MTEVYLGIGGNIGDRRLNIDQALSLLSETGIKVEKVSEVIETEPWGFEAKGMFLNCVARCCVNGKIIFPERLLHICKAVERQLGRSDQPEYDSEGRRLYHSRTIDIDILFYGEKRIHTASLTVPHPQILQRDFVLIPLRQIASEDLVKRFPEYFQ